MQGLNWSDKVKKRDGNRCVLCGSSEKLQAHHVKPTFLYPECSADIENGVTLCKSCHQTIHSGHFAGYKVLPVNGADPDPEGRMQAYEEARKTENARRRRIAWGSTKKNEDIIRKAAEAAGQRPGAYISEAISLRLTAEGFQHDTGIFDLEWFD